MRGHDWINTCLPDDLILEILRRVDSKASHDSCSLVCKRWLRLERLSRTTLRIGASGSPDLFVMLLAQRFVNVKAVHIDERLSISLPVNVGKRRGRDENSLTSLKVHYAAEKSGSEEEDCESFCLTDAGLTAVADGFSKLEKLSLIWCSNVTSLGIMSLAQKCSFLKSLDLQGCYVGDQGLAVVGKCCKQLEDLNLRFCESLTDAGLVDLVTGCGKSLKSLGMAACARITDKSLEAVGSQCKSLENLSLDSEFIRNKGILAIAQGCPLLKVLKLQCINVTDRALIAVGVSCLSLEMLALRSFQQFTDERLTELALLYCQRIGNFALHEVGKGCKYLQALHLVDCSSIGDEAICSIAKGCRNLKKLHIRRCYEVGNKGIIAVGEHCHSLTDLSLRFCDRVRDEALIAIGQGCPLQHLNVSGCNQIGDAGILAIARGCPQLTYLDVSVLQNLGDMALAELGEGCPLLKDIVLSHCHQITDVGLSHLVKKCQMLESCHMVYCPSITAAGVATVVSSCPNIKKVLVEKWKVSPRTKRRAGSVLSYLCVDL
ncbi:F-box/LRR-repeat protein 4 isoform X3 [Durio zibethinus]|uniref:F-box/LRR-repeat protein 4 isoform X3 n=1 Tax=Durio zibethinus TaxID=66656 RepID=A0A6P6A6J4_DURZI|nr:F-box/LRR-repeat protein 4 isoform X3 [Durio zibethinus]